jgi:hypothetical protein
VARGTDTVVKARYSRGLHAAIRLAKDHVRYAVHRPDEHGRRQYRELWDRDGQISKQVAYTRLDDVKHPDYIYRLTLSPHPERQDPGRRLDLRAWTRGMMQQLEQRAGQQLAWFAAVHEHPDHRHIHVVAVTERRLEVRDLQALREAGDNHALDQQRQHFGKRVATGRQGLRHPARDHELERDRPPRPIRSITPTELAG